MTAIEGKRGRERSIKLGGLRLTAVVMGMSLSTLRMTSPRKRSCGSEPHVSNTATISWHLSGQEGAGGLRG
eukprot:1916148-Rhodomonas_salina.1